MGYTSAVGASSPDSAPNGRFWGDLGRTRAIVALHSADLTRALAMRLVGVMALWIGAGYCGLVVLSLIRAEDVSHHFAVSALRPLCVPLLLAMICGVPSLAVERADEGMLALLSEAGVGRSQWTSTRALALSWVAFQRSALPVIVLLALVAAVSNSWASLGLRLELLLVAALLMAAMSLALAALGVVAAAILPRWPRAGFMALLLVPEVLGSLVGDFPSWLSAASWMLSLLGGLAAS